MALWPAVGRKAWRVNGARGKLFMEDGFQFLDIILFAAVAAFFVLRLRGVLGKRTGHEEPPPGHDAFGRRRKAEDEDGKVIPLPDRAGQPDAPDAEFTDAAADEEFTEEMPALAEAPAATLEAGLAQVRKADKSFNDEEFLNGTRACFELVINAFAAGDAKALRPLLSNDVYGDFAGAIEERGKAAQTLETTLVGINVAEIAGADVQGRTAFITIKFVSEQINVLRDKDGEMVEGDPNHVTKITDLWTFARNTNSRDPNWTLVATGSPG